MEFAKRLKELRVEKHFTQKDLADAVNVTDVAVGNWERGVSVPNLGTVVMLASALGVTLDELVFSQKIPVRPVLNLLSDNAQRLISQYRDLDETGKAVVETVCDLEYRRLQEQSRDKIPLSSSRQIRVYRTPAAAGVSVPIEGGDFDVVLANSSVPKRADFGVRIQGDSMEPVIADGDIVYVEKDADISAGDIGIFCVDGAMYCKEYRRDREGNVTLYSLNPERQDCNIYLSADSGSTLTCLGRVLPNRAR